MQTTKIELWKKQKEWWNLLETVEFIEWPNVKLWTNVLSALLIKDVTDGHLEDGNVVGSNTETPNVNLKHKTHVTSCGRKKPTAAVTTWVMKNTKRAYRRHKKRVKFEKRLNDWFSYWGDTPWKYENIEKARLGEGWTFLRTTGKPCSCDGCSPNYKRPPKSKTQKEIWDGLYDCWL